MNELDQKQEFLIWLDNNEKYKKHEEMCWQVWKAAIENYEHETAGLKIAELVDQNLHKVDGKKQQ